MKNKKKVLLTAGGTGGHIIPLLAIADRLLEVGKEDLCVEYIGPNSNFIDEFQKRKIYVHKIIPSKIRRYLSLQNLIDIPKFILSIFQALIKMYFIMPDIVFSKGGPGSFPIVLASKFYFIPVIIHESDSVPSLNSRLSSKFANKIAVSFRKTMDYLPKDKVFFSGKPLNVGMFKNWLLQNQAKEHFDFDTKDPVVLILGGSQGSQKINELVIDNLELMLKNFQIYHQVGWKNITSTQKEIELIIKKLPPFMRNRYKFVGFLNKNDYKFAFNASDIVISRSGSVIFDIAAFGKPAVLIPLSNSANNHQKINAYEYAGNGAAIVIEETNLDINIIIRQIKKILDDPERIKHMSEAAKNFAKPNADTIIVQEIINFLNK